MADGSLAGTARQNYVPGGPVTVGFTPDPDAADQIAALTEQLETQLREYRASIAEQVKPWSDEWAAAQNWGAKIALLQDARDRGLRRGASAWGEDQVGFLEQVGGWASDAGSWVVEQGEDLVDWYSDLPMLGKVFPGIYAAGEGIDAAGEALEDASEEIQRLWAQREALFEFFKALYEQSVDAVQITIETLAAMGGELGELMQAMWDQGAEWVQGLIEMCRESEILQRIFASVGALFAALPPNLWAEGIGVGVGYIVPELLISVVLAVLAAISAGAGAAALAARLLGYGARLREALSQHGRLGRVLLAVYDGIGHLADNIAALVRALWRNISETVEGAVDRTNRILRNSKSSVRQSTRAQMETSARLGVHPRWIKPNGDVLWPPNNGFSGSIRTEQLQKGQLIDRYGSPRGGFLSPAGTDFNSRALPANSVNSEFHTYRVVKPFDVDAGEAAPWFDQPGGATQYRLKNTNVQGLLDDGYIQEVPK